MTRLLETFHCLIPGIEHWDAIEDKQLVIVQIFAQAILFYLIYLSFPIFLVFARPKPCHTPVIAKTYHHTRDPVFTLDVYNQFSSVASTPFSVLPKKIQTPQSTTSRTISPHNVQELFGLQWILRTTFSCVPEISGDGHGTPGTTILDSILACVEVVRRRCQVCVGRSQLTSTQT